MEDLDEVLTTKALKQYPKKYKKKVPGERCHTVVNGGNWHSGALSASDDDHIQNP